LVDAKDAMLLKVGSRNVLHAAHVQNTNVLLCYWQRGSSGNSLLPGNYTLNYPQVGQSSIIEVFDNGRRHQTRASWVP
jgi:hypothetical protein